MNPARYQSVLQNLTAISRRVYDAVPIAESWTLQQIMAELFRTGKRVDKVQIGGCLNTLNRAGLVREHPTGLFRRTHDVPEDEAPEFEEPPVTQAAPVSAFDRLTAVAAGLRSAAAELEEIALHLPSEVDAKELEKLRTLKALLNDIGK